MNNSKNILVVDDSSSNLLAMERILGKEGFNVYTTANGEEAVDIMRDRAIDVVLLDLMMPGFSGFDVLGSIKKDSSLADIPVIIVSARSDSRDIRLVLEEGAVDFIKKPIDINELVARTKSAISLSLRQKLLSKIKSTIVGGEEIDTAILSTDIKKLRDIGTGKLSSEESKFIETLADRSESLVEKYILLKKILSI